MLPDFPELKRKLGRLLEARMKHVHASHTSSLSEVGMFHIPEGNRVMFIDEDGIESEIPMKRHRVTIKITDEEIESLTPEEIVGRFDKAAQEMATQTGKTFIESLDQSVRSVGNVFEYHGQITANDLLTMYEKVLIDFDDQGRPQLPTLVCGEKMYSQVTEVLPEIESDPEVKRRFDLIMAKKREEWRDRESSRKLAE
jgi:hypothetical protein